MQPIGAGTPHVDEALVIDAAQRAALVPLRELGRAGLRTCAVDTNVLAPGLSSRWSSCRATVPDVRDDPDTFVDALLALCREHRPRVLLACHDGSIGALRRRRGEVEGLVRLALAPEDALGAAINKQRTLTAAQELGIPVPRGVIVEQVDQVARAVKEIGLPVVIKPVESWAQNGHRGVRLAPAVAQDNRSAEAQVVNILDHGLPVVLQEWLPGDREAINIFFAAGRVWARFAQRALRTSPPLGGNSVVRESIALPSDSAADAERLVRALGLEGYSEVEFRRDGAGTAALMEVNPRLSASVEIAVRAGVGFPRLLYDWASGAPLVPMDGYQTGVRMRWLGGDVAWLGTCLRAGRGPDVPSRTRTIGLFVGDFFRPSGYDYVHRDDLRPAGAAIVGAYRRYAHERNGRGAHGLDTEAAVIGAGPYGLAVSAHLRSAGTAHEVFGQTMDSWDNHMPAGMYLKSEGFASNISEPGAGHTLERFCAEAGIPYGRVGAPIMLDTFVRYGHWFQQRVVPDVRPVLVRRVGWSSGAFDLTLANGDSLRAGRVIVAIGFGPFAFVPPELRGLASGQLVHSYQADQVQEGDGADLLVIGAGQSALEAAALAAEGGATVSLLARAPRILWNTKPLPRPRPLSARLRFPESGLGDGRGQYAYANYPWAFHGAPLRLRLQKAYSVLGPAGAWWLRPRFEGRVQAALGRSVVDASSADGRVLVRVRAGDVIEEHTATQVLAATGYRPEVSRLELLDDALRQRLVSVAGTPVLDRHFESSVSGLHFVGYLAVVSFGPVMRFVFGTDFAARAVASRLRA